MDSVGGKEGKKEEWEGGAVGGGGVGGGAGKRGPRQVHCTN